MKRLCTILATALAAALQAGVPRHWEADVRNPAAYQTAAYRGETVAIEAQLADRGAPFEVPEGATARMLVSTNDFRDGCWEWPATVSTSGLVRATWTPDMDPGGPAVRIFLAVSESGTNVNYGANCTMRLLGSPGATPGALPLPAATIDFAAVRAINPPWVEEESDPVFAEWAETNEYARTINGFLLKDGNINISATNGIAMDGRVLGNINNLGYKRLVEITFGLDPEALDKFATWDGLAEWYGDATNYTDAALAAIGMPDYSRENAELVATIEAVAPAPGDYAAVSNAAMSALQSFDESDPLFAEWSLTNNLESAIAEQAAENQLLYQLVVGTNVVLEVTNYNSRVHAPAIRVLQLGTNGYAAVWSETNGLARTLAAATAHSDTNRAELAAEAEAAYAPRAWSGTTSGLGADAPEGYTWMSTPNTVIAGGLEFEKHVTTGGAIWILRSNGMTADFHAQTNNTAFLDLSCADGTPVFRVEKTDSYLVGVDVTSLSVSGDALICGVNAIAAEHPLARVRTSLTSGSWIKEEDGIPAEIATVQWSGSSGAWVCEITNNSGGNSIFATMEYLQEGSTKIVNAAPIDVSQGILCTDGIHRVRPVWNNGSVTWEAVQ